MHIKTGVEPWNVWSMYKLNLHMGSLYIDPLNIEMLMA